MKNRTKQILCASGIAACASVFTALTFAATGLLGSSSPQADVNLSAAPAASRTSAGLVPVNMGQAGVPTDFTQAAESTINGVVSIKSFVNARQQRYGSRQDFFSDPFFEYFFGGGRNRRQTPAPDSNNNQGSDEEAQQQSGLGSGVILTQDGYIVTNNHVISGADRLEITLNDNRTFNATVIGADEATDLALIKIDATELPVIPVGDSDALRVGEWVLAVGNPFGLTSTVTSGIVSAKARSISEGTHTPSMGGVESYIQTDAAVNPGNSGGALVNLAGELVGINTAIYSQTGNYAGHSFAIPTAIVNKVVGDLKQYGAVQRAFLGVTFRPLDAKLAKEKGITATASGIYIASVLPNSAASDAGLQEGDVITAISGVHVGTEAQLRGLINRYSPGDEVSVTYLRDNKERSATLKLLNSSGSTAITRAGHVSELGCTFGTPSAETLKQLRLDGGVEITAIEDGLFKSNGIRKGFIITEVNQTAVRSAKEIERLYKAAMQQGRKALYVGGYYPSGKWAAYAVNIAE